MGQSSMCKCLEKWPHSMRWCPSPGPLRAWLVMAWVGGVSWSPSPGLFLAIIMKLAPSSGLWRNVPESSSSPLSCELGVWRLNGPSVMPFGICSNRGCAESFFWTGKRDANLPVMPGSSPKRKNGPASCIFGEDPVYHRLVLEPNSIVQKTWKHV